MSKILKLSELRKRQVPYENDAVYISEHAFKRIKQRVGWNRKTALRMIERVYSKGLKGNQLKGYPSIWISQRPEKFADFEEIILYGNHLYLFSNKVLVTVYHIPSRETCLKEAV